jgi:hypothetical protein
MEIWGELSLPSDPLALADSNMFESIDDSEHDQYEDDLEVDDHNPVLNLDVCNAAKALESVLSEALGKYPLLILDDQKIAVESMENSRTQGRSTKSKIRRTISASLFGDCVDSFDETGNLLEIWEEDELHDEISSIEEEIERIQQQKYVNETSIPYSPRSESPCNTLFFEEYTCDFLQDPEDVADSSSDSSPLNSPLCSPPQSFPPPVSENDNNCVLASSSSTCDDSGNGSACKSVANPTTTSSAPATDSLTISKPSEPSEQEEEEEDKSKKRTAETEKPNTREKRRRNNTKNCLSKSFAIEASLSVAVNENSSGSPRGKPPRRKKSKKRKIPKKKQMEAIFRKEEVLTISSVGDDEVDVTVDIGDASDFTNY